MKNGYKTEIYMCKHRYAISLSNASMKHMQKQGIKLKPVCFNYKNKAQAWWTCQPHK